MLSLLEIIQYCMIKLRMECIRFLILILLNYIIATMNTTPVSVYIDLTWFSIRQFCVNNVLEYLHFCDQMIIFVYLVFVRANVCLDFFQWNVKFFNIAHIMGLVLMIAAKYFLSNNVCRRTSPVAWDQCKNSCQKK